MKYTTLMVTTDRLKSFRQAILTSFGYLLSAVLVMPSYLLKRNIGFLVWEDGKFKALMQFKKPVV